MFKSNKKRDAKIVRVYRATKSVTAVSKAVGLSLAGAFNATIRLGVKRAPRRKK